MLHFTDEVPLRFTNNLLNPSSLSVSSSSLSTKGPGNSLTTLGTSIVGDAHQTSLIIPSDPNNTLLNNHSTNNKSLDAKK